MQATEKEKHKSKISRTLALGRKENKADGRIILVQTE